MASSSSQEVEPPEPSKLDTQLQSCNLSLYGGRNDCVWATIAHLLGMTIEKLKLNTGLSPTQGIEGIHANAVKGLLTSLARDFYGYEIGGGGFQVGGILIESFQDLLDRMGWDSPAFSPDNLRNRALAVCYTRSDGFGHCVVYERVYTATPKNRGFRPFRPVPGETTTSGAQYRFIDYSQSPATDVGGDVLSSRIRLVFYMGGARQRPRLPLAAEQERVDLRRKTMREQEKWEGKRH